MKLLGFGGGGQLVSFADKQRKPNGFFKVVQQAADHRLTDIHGLCRLGDRAVGHKGVEAFKLAQFHSRTPMVVCSRMARGLAA